MTDFAFGLVGIPILLLVVLVIVFAMSGDSVL